MKIYRSKRWEYTPTEKRVTLFSDRRAIYLTAEENSLLWLLISNRGKQLNKQEAIRFSQQLNTVAQDNLEQLTNTLVSKLQCKGDTLIQPNGYLEIGLAIEEVVPQESSALERNVQSAILYKALLPVALVIIVIFSMIGNK